MASETSCSSNFAPWAVVSWPEVEYYLPKQRARWPRFRQGGISFECQPAGQLQAGTSVWVTEIADKQVGLAWDWVETRNGVVALIDPNGIVSNLRFLRDEDHFESPAAAVVSATRLVHALPWQKVVQHELGTARAKSSRPGYPNPTPALGTSGALNPLLASPLRAPMLHTRV